MCYMYVFLSAIAYNYFTVTEKLHYCQAVSDLKMRVRENILIPTLEEYYNDLRYNYNYKEQPKQRL